MDAATRLDLSLLSAALVAQRDDVTSELIVTIRERGEAREAVREAIIQTMLHDGYATALEGVLLLQRIWPGGPEPIELGEYSDHEQWRERGERLFERIYGDVGEKVIGNVNSVSPELATWMVTEGYGKVLSRGNLDTATRELCTVAVLVMKRRERQLTSHLRGALRVGVKQEEIQQLLDRIGESLGVTEEAKKATMLLDFLKVK